MAIQTVEARIHSVPRNFTDVIAFLVIGVVLLALLPAKREAVTAGVARTSAETPLVFFSRVFSRGDDSGSAAALGQIGDTSR